MKVIFEKNRKGLFDVLIRWWTKSPYSHVELLFNDDMMFSSVPGVGTRFDHAGILSANQWDVLFIPTSESQDKAIRAFCDGELGHKYDWKGIFFSQIIRMRRHCAGKWFCSEICTAALQAAGLMPTATPCTLSPGQLHKRLKETGAIACTQ